MKLVIFLFLFLILFPANPAKASLNSDASTREVCKFLDSKGAKTTTDYHKYKYDETTWGCNTSYIEIGVGTTEWSLANNVAFYVEGKENEVNKISLILNVNNAGDAKKAHSKLLILSEELFYKITGANLPKNIKEAIINGKNLKKIKSKPLSMIDPIDSDIKTPNIRELKVKLKNLNIKIEKDVWTTGLGYSVIVTIT
jgi:hypothetical protein